MSSAEPLKLPKRWWIVASELDTKLAHLPGDDGDRRTYDDLARGWASLPKGEQLQGWETLTDRGLYALADALGHGLEFEAYLGMKQDDYDGQEAELKELRDSITADLSD